MSARIIVTGAASGIGAAATAALRDRGARVVDAAAAITRAAPDSPVRDLATTRRGGVGYAFLSRLPRRWVDRGVQAGVQRARRRGNFGLRP